MFDSKPGTDLVGTPPEIEPADLVEELDAVLARITREEAKVLNCSPWWSKAKHSGATDTHRLLRCSSTAMRCIRMGRRKWWPGPGTSLRHNSSLSPTPRQRSPLLRSTRYSTPARRPLSRSPKEQAGLVEMAMDTPLVEELRKRLNYWMECVAEDEVDARDLRCVFPGCDRPAHWCDAHHLVHWIDGGETCVQNLILLCRHHHTLIHDHGWRIEGEPGSLTFYRPDGTEWAEPVPVPPAPRQRGPNLTIETIKEIGALKQQPGRASPD